MLERKKEKEKSYIYIFNKKYGKWKKIKEISRHKTNKKIFRVNQKMEKRYVQRIPGGEK